MKIRIIEGGSGKQYKMQYGFTLQEIDQTHTDFFSDF